MVNKSYTNKKGITLVEIIIAFAILSILFVAAFSLFSFGNRTFATGNKQYNTQSSARLATDYIIQEVRFAASLDILSDPPTTKVIPYNYFYVKNGSLHHDVYNGTSYETFVLGDVILDSPVPFTKKNDSTLGITISSKDGNQNYSIPAEIELPNFEILTRTVNGTSGKALSYSTDASLPGLPASPSPIPGPGPSPGTDETVIVTIRVDKNNCRVYINQNFIQREVGATGNPAQNFVFNNVLKNTEITYTIIDDKGITVKDSVALTVEDKDLTVFVSIKSPTAPPVIS